MTIKRMLEAIAGEYIGDKNRLTIWTPDKAGKVAIAWVKFDPRTRRWALQYNDNAPQGVIEEFKNSAPEEHIKAMIKQAATGDFEGDDGKFDFIFKGGQLVARNPD